MAIAKNKTDYVNTKVILFGSMLVESKKVYSDMDIMAVLI